MSAPLTISSNECDTELSIQDVLHIRGYRLDDTIHLMTVHGKGDNVRRERYPLKAHQLFDHWESYQSQARDKACIYMGIATHRGGNRCIAIPIQMQKDVILVEIDRGIHSTVKAMAASGGFQQRRLMDMLVLEGVESFKEKYPELVTVTQAHAEELATNGGLDAELTF